MPERAVHFRADDVRVSFTGVEGGLESLSGRPLAFELCGETQESCRFAEATVSAGDVILSGDGRPKSRVRYAWADSPMVNTSDARESSLPGFENAIGP